MNPWQCSMHELHLAVKSIYNCLIRHSHGRCEFIVSSRRCLYWIEPCGVHSVDTKSEIVKILHFKQFYKHYVFVEDGEGGRKKVLKNYIDVNVCIDMVCGDTRNELGSEE